MHEHLPNFLGIGKVDESIYARLWTKLDDPQKGQVNELNIEMEDYEVDCLRLVIANMQPPVQKVTKIAAASAKGETGQPAKEEIIFGNDLGLEFLKALAKRVGVLGAKATVQELRTNRFIIKNPVSHRQYQAWLALVKWVKTNVLELFGVKRLKDITLDHFAEQIQRISAHVPPQLDAEINPGFWILTFKIYPIVTWGCLIVITLSVVAIATA
ncbi:MAG: hypothetical protein ACYC6X_00255 [Minisyncoccota bacterium]